MPDGSVRNPLLITGVGKRVGLALAQHFMQRGQPVIGTYRSERAELNGLWEAGATLLQCDFYQQASVAALIDKIRETTPALRGIIHNASDWLPDSSGADHAHVIEKMMTVHVNVPYQLNMSLQTLLRADTAPLKHIIHITDYVAEKGSKKHIAYAASKAALANMTLSFAARFAPDISVNAIAPALLLFNEMDTDDYKANAVKKALLQKEGGLQELIASVDFLLASTFITGRTLYLDGGRHLV